MVILTLLLLLSCGGGTALALLTYPTVTITIEPVSRQITLTTLLPTLPTRTLAPVTLTRSETAPTTGRGHQDARRATGLLTFYNGLFAPQTLPAGTVFVGADGVRVVTSAPVTIPAGNPPNYGQASVQAHALQAGSRGNLAAGDLDATIESGVLVKSGPFEGGQDARDFAAVAPADLDRLSATLKAALNQQMPQAFALHPGEAAQPLACTFTTTPTHQAGEEAASVTMRASETCPGLAYEQAQMQQQATQAFTSQTSPGASYSLEGQVQVQGVTPTPLTVSCRGEWVYILSPEYEQFLAQRIAGESSPQAQQYLLHTGFVTRATVPDTLPPDPAHIHFQILIGL